MALTVVWTEAGIRLAGPPEPTTRIERAAWTSPSFAEDEAAVARRGATPGRSPRWSRSRSPWLIRATPSPTTPRTPAPSSPAPWPSTGSGSPSCCCWPAWRRSSKSRSSRSSFSEKTFRRRLPRMSRSSRPRPWPSAATSPTRPPCRPFSPRSSIPASSPRPPRPSRPRRSRWTPSARRGRPPRSATRVSPWSGSPR